MYKFLRSRKVAPKELQSTCTVDFRGRVIAAAAAEEDIANDRNGNGAEVRFLFHGKKVSCLNQLRRYECVCVCVWQ